MAPRKDWLQVLWYDPGPFYNTLYFVKSSAVKNCKLIKGAMGKYKGAAVEIMQIGLTFQEATKNSKGASGKTNKNGRTSVAKRKPVSKSRRPTMSKIPSSENEPSVEITRKSEANSGRQPVVSNPHSLFDLEANENDNDFSSTLDVVSPSLNLNADQTHSIYDFRSPLPSPRHNYSSGSGQCDGISPETVGQIQRDITQIRNEVTLIANHVPEILRQTEQIFDKLKALTGQNREFESWRAAQTTLVSDARGQSVKNLDAIRKLHATVFRRTDESLVSATEIANAADPPLAIGPAFDLPVNSGDHLTQAAIMPLIIDRSVYVGGNPAMKLSSAEYVALKQDTENDPLKFLWSLLKKCFGDELAGFSYSGAGQKASLTLDPRYQSCIRQVEIEYPDFLLDAAGRNKVTVNCNNVKKKLGANRRTV